MVDEKNKPILYHGSLAELNSRGVQYGFAQDLNYIVKFVENGSHGDLSLIDWLNEKLFEDLSRRGFDGLVNMRTVDLRKTYYDDCSRGKDLIATVEGTPIVMKKE